MTVVNMEAKRATYAQLDQHLIDSMSAAVDYTEMGIDVAAIIEGKPLPESDGLVALRRTLIEAQKRIKQLSPYLEN